MNRMGIARASLVCAIVVCGCSSSGSGGGGSATPSAPSASEPTFGTGSETAGTSEPGQTAEPTTTKTGNEPATGGLDTTPGQGRTAIGVCTRVCARIQSVCPGAAGGANCASECAASTLELGACLPLYLDALDCLADSQIMCAGGDIAIGGCQAEVDAFGTCLNTMVRQPGD